MDYSKGKLEEIAYNKIPEFTNFKDDWTKDCFYYYKADFAPNEVLKFLKRAYQTYKSAYYLDQIRDPSQFY